MSEHTPTLMVQDGDIWDVRADGAAGVPLFRADNEYRRWGRDVSRAEKEQLAALIVRAVNSHAKLRAALEEIRDLTAADGGLPILAAHDIARRALEES